MPDRDDRPDPIDEAYVRAEAALDDAAARAARRARVLGAVAAAETKTPAPAVRRPLRRSGGWLAAAGVAGLSVWTAVHIYKPASPPPPAPPPPAAAPVSSASTAGRPLVQPPAAAAKPEPARVAKAFPRQVEAIPVAPPADIAPPPPLPIPPVERPIAPPPPAPPPPPIVAGMPADPAPSAKNGVAESVVVTGSRIQQRNFTASTLITPAEAQQAGPAAALRAAAAAGRTADIEMLLSQGVSVDAPDAAGDTALMKAVQAARPAAAAILVRHGADLDLKNHAGASARDMASTRNDPAMNRALLGLD